MARYKKLSRDDLLDAALDVIINKGPKALSIGNVATAAGVSKGGIQSNFETREKLIEALFERWSMELDTRCREIAEHTHRSAASLDVFLEAAFAGQREKPRQDAAMIFLMTESEKHRSEGRDWVRHKMKSFEAAGEDSKSIELRFMVLQSILIAKSLDLMPFEEATWDKMLADVDQRLRN